MLPGVNAPNFFARRRCPALYGSLAAALVALAGCAPCGGCPAEKACVIAFDGVPEVCLDRCDPASARPCPADRTCVQAAGGPTCARNP